MVAHEMSVINKEGDTTVEWDPDNEAQVAVARSAWDSLVTGKGYSAFSVNEDGTAGGRVRRFDPTLEKIILVPPMAGGCGA